MDNRRQNRTREITRLRVARFRKLQEQETLQNRHEDLNEMHEGNEERDVSHDLNRINEVQPAANIGEAHDAVESMAVHEDDIPGGDNSDEANEPSSAHETGSNNVENESSEERDTNDSDATNESMHIDVENDSGTSEDSNDEAIPVPIEEDSDEDEVGYGELQELRVWAYTTKIPHIHLNSLLGILRRRLLPDLPKTAVTFLRTNDAEYNIQTVRSRDNRDVGSFVYFGIKLFLLQMINVGLHVQNVLHLLFNIDGLPLFKSSSMQFWPILCKVYFEPDIYKPFPVAIFAGNEKPPDLDEFFHDFITEINQLLQNGIEIEGQIFEVRIKSFICDRPARSYVKCIIGHTGYYACERCTVHGERVDNRTIYPAVDASRRTNASFRDQENQQHHNGLSPLLLIEPMIDLVTQFSLDFMHLCCLGVMKKMLLEFWLDSTVATFIGQNNKCRLDTYLKLLSSQVPEEFQRTTRSLGLINKWKATEFRLFLLYIGPVVLKTILSQTLYKHFLLFHAACRILCCADWAIVHNNQASRCLESFFLIAAELYRARCQIMNMHSLIHLADDVMNMNCSLIQLTAFPFENTLGKLKSMIRSGNRPLAQVCRRMHESFYTDYPQASLPPNFRILSATRQRPDGSQPIKKIEYKGYIISKKSPNNAILLRNGKILQIHDIYKRENEDSVNVEGFLLRIKKSIYEYPCDSSTLGMWQVTKTQVSKIFSVESIDRKLMLLDLSTEANQKIYAISFLHSE